MLLYYFSVAVLVCVCVAKPFSGGWLLGLCSWLLFFVLVGFENVASTRKIKQCSLLFLFYFYFCLPGCFLVGASKHARVAYRDTKRSVLFLFLFSVGLFYNAKSWRGADEELCCIALRSAYASVLRIHTRRVALSWPRYTASSFHRVLMLALLTLVNG